VGAHGWPRRRWWCDDPGSDCVPPLAVHQVTKHKNLLDSNMKTLERRLAEILAGARARLDDQVTPPHHTAAPGAPARGTRGDNDPTLRAHLATLHTTPRAGQAGPGGVRGGVGGVLRARARRVC
jgi:hypothetical protein